MALNTEYGKSGQGALKIFELVSISRKIKPFFIDLGYVKLTSFWKQKYRIINNSEQLSNEAVEYMQKSTENLTWYFIIYSTC